MAKKKKWQEPIHAEVEQAEKDFTVMPSEAPAETAEDIIDAHLDAEAAATPEAASAPTVAVNVEAPTPTPATKPPEMTDEQEMNQFVDYDIDNIAGDDEEMQQLIKDLKSTATTDMKPSHKVAMAILALSNPETARRRIEKHGADKDRAQQTLLGLGTGLMKQRQADKKQAAIADRATQAQIASADKAREASVAREDLSLKKIDHANKSAMIQSRTAALSDNFIPTTLVPPTDLDDDAAFHEYMIKSMGELTFGQKANEAITMWEKYSAARPDSDPDVAEDSFRTLMVANGVPPVQVEKMLQGYGPRVRALAKITAREKQLEDDKIQAQLDAAESNLRVNEARVQQIKSAVRKNDYTELSRLSGEVQDMGAETRQIQQQLMELEAAGQMLNQKFEESQAGYGDMSQETYFAMSEENQRRRTLLTQHLARTEDLWRTAQKDMAGAQRKLDFDANFTRVLDATMADFQADFVNSLMAQDPDSAIQSPEFHKRMNNALKLEYPGLSLNDLQDAVHRDRVQKAAIAQAQQGFAEVGAGMEAPLIETGSGQEPGMVEGALRHIPGGEPPGGTPGSERRSAAKKDK